MNTADVLSRFRTEYQVARSISELRAAEQLRLLTRVGASLDDRSLLELSQQDLLGFLGSELTRGLSPNSVRKQMMMLRSFVTWAHTAGLMHDEQVRLIKLVGTPRGSSAQSTPKPYAPKEVKAFKAQLATKYPLLPEYGRGSRMLPWYLKGKTPSLRGQLWRHARRLQYEAQISLALEMALRCKEIHTLTIDAAHYENDTVVVTTAKTGPGEIVHRQIPWTPHAHGRMMTWMEFRALIAPPNDSLWLTLDYHGVGIDQLNAQTQGQIHDSLEVFGGGWRWHRFRHTAATEWLRAGMPVEKLQVMMGHGRIEQTLAYTKIVHSDISDAMTASGEAFARRMGLAA